MSRYHNHSGIILHRQVLPKDDVILSLLTPHGQVRLVARAAVAGKRAARLNQFQHVSLQVYAKPNNPLPTLTQVVLEGALFGITRLAPYAYAHLLAELCRKMVPEYAVVGYSDGEHATPAGAVPEARAMFELFAGALRGLVSHPDPDRVALVLAWKLLVAAGLEPRLNVCVVSGETGNLARFDPRRGGAVTASVEQGLVVGARAVAELRRSLRHTVREALAEPLPPELRLSLWQMLEAYVTEQVGVLHAWEVVRPHLGSAGGEATGQTQQTDVLELLPGGF
jgi:DNA repair protein RecO (recombination protein O)